MVLTVEPGIYFIETQMDLVKKDEKLKGFVNAERLDQVRDSTRDRPCKISGEFSFFPGCVASGPSP